VQAYRSASRNAVKAVAIIDQSFLRALNLVSTHNKSTSKREVWFDFMDGRSQQTAGKLQPLFSIVDRDVSRTAFHRAEFLEELVDLLPKYSVQF
jgi:salicylate hydroxylase